LDDYVAIYNPSTSKTTRLTLTGLTDPRGLNVHGMDVVPSSTDPSKLWLYLVNHRPPLNASPKIWFTDPSIEIFKHTLGSATATHVRTVSSPEIIQSPNDVLGSADGTHFWFSNDGTHHFSPLSYARQFLLGARLTSVGYCHVDSGCKIAAGGLRGANGLVRKGENMFFVGSQTRGEVRVLERQPDDSLVATDLIAVDMTMDNLSIDKDGTIWAAGTSRHMDPFLRYQLSS
jgi:arylesterase/paraoxonase